jgi:pilus assembly protein Flp/PilA
MDATITVKTDGFDRGFSQMTGSRTPVGNPSVNPRSVGTLFEEWAEGRRFARFGSLASNRFIPFMLADACRRDLLHQTVRDIMKVVTQSIKNFLVSEDGPTAVEYAVMLALIIIVCLAAITAVGNTASAKFQAINTALGGTP